MDKNYCPMCRAFLPSEPHKPMCELKVEPTKGPVGHTDILGGQSYTEFYDRLAIVIEETLHRHRKIVAVTTMGDAYRFYGSIFWTEGQ